MPTTAPCRRLHLQPLQPSARAMLSDGRRMQGYVRRQQLCLLTRLVRQLRRRSGWRRLPGSPSPPSSLARARACRMAVSSRQLVAAATAQARAPGGRRRQHGHRPLAYGVRCVSSATPLKQRPGAAVAPSPPSKFVARIYPIATHTPRCWDRFWWDRRPFYPIPKTTPYSSPTNQTKVILLKFF